MTQSTPTTAKRPLIHHPSDVLDQFCQCDSTSATWAEFDARLSDALRDFETRHQSWFTPKAVLKSLGR